MIFRSMEQLVTQNIPLLSVSVYLPFIMLFFMFVGLKFPFYCLCFPSLFLGHWPCHE